MRITKLISYATGEMFILEAIYIFRKHCATRNIKIQKIRSNTFDRREIRKTANTIYHCLVAKLFDIVTKVYFLFEKKFYWEWPYVNPNNQKTKLTIVKLKLI